jgi:hypothetical protein
MKNLNFGIYEPLRDLITQVRDKNSCIDLMGNNTDKSIELSKMHPDSTEQTASNQLPASNAITIPQKKAVFKMLRHHNFFEVMRALSQEAILNPSIRLPGDDPNSGSVKRTSRTARGKT